MKHTFKNLPNSVIELEVKLNKKEFDDYWRQVYDGALAKIEIKGFRKGAAPQQLADQFINKEAILEQTINEAVRHSLNEVVQENNWTIIDQPKVEISDAKNGLEFKAKLVIFPEIKLGDYKKIAKNILKDRDKNIEEIKVSDQEINQSLDWLRQSRAKTKVVDRPARNGDVVDINVQVGKDKKQHDKFILGKGNFLPGFEEKLIGKKSGEKTNFSLLVKNKQEEFLVEINSVLERELPEVNDDFAKNLGKFNNLSDLKASIESGLKAERKFKEEEKTKIKILKEIASQAKVDLPENMVNKVLDQMVKQTENDWKNQGKKEEDVRSELKESAQEKIVANLVIYKISEQEGLKPTENEIEEELRKHQYQQNKLDDPKFYDYIYGIIQNKKVFNFLENL